jgi:hypothetical protein
LKWLDGLSLVWQAWQSVAPAAWWLNVASRQLEVLWHCEHWPLKWLAGLSLLWQAWQSVAPIAWWLNVAWRQFEVV